MTHIESRRRALQGLLGALATAALPAFGADYPDKPIHLLVPFPPGGLTDVLGRMVGERLQKSLGQPVIVENRPGAGTLLGAGVVAKAAPDGYTLMIATSTTLGIAPSLYEGTPFRISDLTGIAMLGDVTLLLVSRPDFPASNAAELVAAVRAKPGGYNFASPGSGTVHHLLMEMLKAQENLQVPHVPYQGSGQALTDMISGRIDFMLLDASIGMPQVKAGKIKLLAVASSKRSALAPETPTLNETYPKLDLQAWQSIAGPAGMPPALVARINAEINRALATPEFRADLSRVGVEARPMGVAEFNEMIRRDAPRWADLVKLSGAKAN
ncbi:MAG: tripartite tricarboxylate transporter substrate binding protein [Caldimonas sp.]